MAGEENRKKVVLDEERDPIADKEAEAQRRSSAEPPGPVKYGHSVGYEVVKNHPAKPIEPGNLDLSKRQIVDHPDGSYGTEYSGTFNVDGKEVLIPLIFDGKKHTDDEAIAQYKKTGQHMGKFNTPANGDYSALEDYANKLHSRKIYVGGQEYHGAGKR